MLACVAFVVSREDASCEKIALEKIYVYLTQTKQTVYGCNWK